jgi:catechol 2,3-dioxygenase-like lactoylglutathione lyase family enzyme
MITAIAFFVYPVADIARSRRFYEDVLGLKVENNFRDEWIEYGIAGSTFAITTTDTDHQAGARGAVVAFEVDDLDKTVVDLKAKNARFKLDIGASPVCRFAVIADPDGNDVIIHKRNS